MTVSEQKLYELISSKYDSSTNMITCSAGLDWYEKHFKNGTMMISIVSDRDKEALSLIQENIDDFVEYKNVFKIRTNPSKEDLIYSYTFSKVYIDKAKNEKIK